jgi:hypothetical protein
MVDQKLKGGSGLVGEMATATGIREYAGYEIPGTDFKIVAISNDARTGTAQLRLDMRISSMFGSTPYFLPVLPMTVSEKNGRVALPVEVTPVATTMAKSGTAFTTTPMDNSQPSTGSAATVPNTPTTASSQPSTGSTTIVPATPTTQTDRLNDREGNIGRAVKTNAINPAVGGLL